MKLVYLCMGLVVASLQSVKLAHSLDGAFADETNCNDLISFTNLNHVADISSNHSTPAIVSLNELNSNEPACAGEYQFARLKIQANGSRFQTELFAENEQGQAISILSINNSTCFDSIDSSQTLNTTLPVRFFNSSFLRFVCLDPSETDCQGKFGISLNCYIDNTSTISSTGAQLGPNTTFQSTSAMPLSSTSAGNPFNSSFMSSSTARGDFIGNTSTNAADSSMSSSAQAIMLSAKLLTLATGSLIIAFLMN